MINTVPKEQDENIIDFTKNRHTNNTATVSHSNIELDTYYINILEEMSAKGCDKDYVKRVIMDMLYKNPDVRFDYNDIVRAVSRKLDDDEAEKEIIAKMNRRRLEQKISIASADYRNQINNALVERKCTVLHYKEVADTLYEDLTEEEKEEFMHKPLYACFEMLNTPQFQKAISKCMERFNRSQSVDNKIQKYIEKSYGNIDPDNYEYVLAEIASFCPTTVYSGEDTRLKAYYAICSMECRSENDCNLTSDDIKKMSDIQEEIAAKFASEMSGHEPINVAAEKVLDDNIKSKIQKTLGKTISAGYNKAADAIIEGIGLDPRIPMTDELSKMMEENPQLALLYKEELKKRKLENRERKERIKNIKQGNVENEYISNPYTGTIYRKESKSYNNKENTELDNSILKILVVAIIVTFLAGKVTGVNTNLSLIAFTVSAFSALTKKDKPMYISGLIGLLLLLFTFL